jgi:hypothetical protein
MTPTRLAASLAVAAMACGGMLATAALAASPAAAAELPPGTCVFEVKDTDHYVPVRQGPGSWFRRVDKLGPFDRTLGACRRYGPEGRWRNVLGLYKTKIGFIEDAYLTKLGSARKLVI